MLSNFVQKYKLASLPIIYEYIHYSIAHILILPYNLQYVLHKNAIQNSNIPNKDNSTFSECGGNQKIVME